MDKNSELRHFAFSFYPRVWIGGYLDCVDDISEGQLSGESEAMVDDGLPGVEVSHIQSYRKKKNIILYHDGLEK